MKPELYSTSEVAESVPSLSSTAKGWGFGMLKILTGSTASQDKAPGHSFKATYAEEHGSLRDRSVAKMSGALAFCGSSATSWVSRVTRNRSGFKQLPVDERGRC